MNCSHTLRLPGCPCCRTPLQKARSAADAGNLVHTSLPSLHLHNPTGYNGSLITCEDLTTSNPLSSLTDRLLQSYLSKRFSVHTSRNVKPMRVSWFWTRQPAGGGDL